MILDEGGMDLALATLDLFFRGINGKGDVGFMGENGVMAAEFRGKGGAFDGDGGAKVKGED